MTSVVYNLGIRLAICLIAMLYAPLSWPGESLQTELAEPKNGALTRETEPEHSQSKYDSTYSMYIDGQMVEVRVSERLFNRSTDGLSSRSLEVHNNAVAVFLDSDNDSIKKEYLSAFPGSFDEFLTIFFPEDFTELYSGSDTYVNLFYKLSLEFPQLGIPKYVSLAVEACYDADAPAFFNRSFRDIRDRFPEMYEQAASELSEAQLRHIALVDEASIHHWEPEEVMCGQRPDRIRLFKSGAEPGSHRHDDL